MVCFVKCTKLPVAKGIGLSYNTLARSLYVIENLRHPLTAPKRHICAAWDLPRKSKNLRPCVAHFFVLHKVFFSSYFVLANHSATPAFLPFGTWADPEKISICLWANPNSPPLYYRSNPKKRAGNPRIFLFEILTGKDRVKNRPCNFLELFQTFLLIFLSISFISLVISCFLPLF